MTERLLDRGQPVDQRTTTLITTATPTWPTDWSIWPSTYGVPAPPEWLADGDQRDQRPTTWPPIPIRARPEPRSPPPTPSPWSRCCRPPGGAKRSPCWPGPGAGSARWWCTRSSPSRRRRCERPDTTPRRVILTAGHGFRLDPAGGPGRRRPGDHRQPDQPDRRAASRRRACADLARPGRVLVVDEAFMDAVPGEPESLIDRGDGRGPGAAVADQDLGAGRAAGRVRRRRRRP